MQSIPQIAQETHTEILGFLPHLDHQLLAQRPTIEQQRAINAAIAGKGMTIPPALAGLFGPFGQQFVQIALSFALGKLGAELIPVVDAVIDEEHQLHPSINFSALTSFRNLLASALNMPVVQPIAPTPGPNPDPLPAPTPGPAPVAGASPAPGWPTSAPGVSMPKTVGEALGVEGHEPRPMPGESAAPPAEGG